MPPVGAEQLAMPDAFSLVGVVIPIPSLLPKFLSGHFGSLWRANTKHQTEFRENAPTDQER